MGVISNTFAKLLGGTKNEREIKRLWPIVHEINRYFESYQSLSDDELKAKTQEFRYRLRRGETLDDLLPEAYAVVKETCRRLLGKRWLVRGIEIEWNMVPFDVQLLGAIVLHQGKIAEMATGEGKTLVATMPLYLNALEGKGVHLVTVNDYLAQRDCEWMGKIYEFLGLTVAALHSEMSPEERRRAYQADITYGTNNEFGFDYLRDNMAVDVWSVVQRDLHYAIVDEVDSLLIDESRTPLIISGSVGAPRNVYYELKPVVANLYRRQQELVNELFRRGKELLDKNEEEAGLQLLRVLRGDPKNPQLLELLTSEFWVKKLIERLQGQYEVNKEMGMVDGELYYTIDEKSHVVDITEKGRIFLSGGRDEDVADKIQLLDEIDDRLASLAEEKQARRFFSQDPVSGLCNGITLAGKVALCGGNGALSTELVDAVNELNQKLAQIPQAVQELGQTRRMEKAAAVRQFFTFSSKIERQPVALTKDGRAYLLQGHENGVLASVVDSLSELLRSLDAEDGMDRTVIGRLRERAGQYFHLDKQIGAPTGLSEIGQTALLALHTGGQPERAEMVERMASLLRSGDARTSAEEVRQDYFEFADNGAIPKHITEKGRIALLGGNPDLYILPDRSLVEERDRQIQELLDRTLNQSTYDYVGRVIVIEKLEKEFNQLCQFIHDKPVEERNRYFQETVDSRSGRKRLRFTSLAKQYVSDYAEQTRQLTLKLDQLIRDAKGDNTRLFHFDSQNRPAGLAIKVLDEILEYPFQEVRQKIEQWRQTAAVDPQMHPIALRQQLDQFLSQAFPAVANQDAVSLSRRYEEVERLARVIGLVFDFYYRSDMAEVEKQRHIRRYFTYDGMLDGKDLSEVRFTGLSDSGMRLLMGESAIRQQIADKLFTLVDDPEIDQEVLFELDEDGLPSGLQKTARVHLLDGLPFFSFTEELSRFREELLHLAAKKVNTRAEWESLLPKEKAYLRGRHILLDDREMNELLFRAHAPNMTFSAEEIEHWCRLHLERKPRQLLEEQRDRKWREYSEVEERVQNISQLLRAYTLYHKDVDYVVKTLDESDLRGRAAGQKGARAVVIVDQFTGRLMPGRRFSDGLHEALEAKEGVEVQAETQTLATITIQNFFRLYKKLAGMTGTAETEAPEFYSTYKLEVVVIPTNKPVIRIDYDDVIFRTKKEKYNAIIEEALAMHAQGRPVLIGTISIDVSQRLSEMLSQRGIPIANWLKKGDVTQELQSGRYHTVLNAKYHRQEAEIISKAGLPGAITIATNMAGRGTDIKLAPEVVQLGGLHIIGSEKHEARRIDRQLRGRAGRQGDPGSSRFYLSLEDDLMRLFGSDRITNIMSRLGPAEEGERIEHPLITRSIERAQKKVEERNFEIRKNLLEYDNVLNEQRKIIYKRRQNLLGFANAEDLVESKAKRFFNEEDERQDWKLEEMIQSLESFFHRKVDFTVEDLEKLKHDEIKTMVRNWVEEQLEEDQLQQQLQLRHRLLGYCSIESVLQELVRLKIRLHNAGSRDTSKWNLAGIGEELQRIFMDKPQWLEQQGGKMEADQLEGQLISWAVDLYHQRFAADHRGFDQAIFRTVKLTTLLQAYIDGLMALHLNETVAATDWKTDGFLMDLQRVFDEQPPLGVNEIRTIRREKLRQMILEWMVEHVPQTDEVTLRHRIVGYFSPHYVIDALLRWLFANGENLAEALTPEQKQHLLTWFGPEALDYSPENKEKLSPLQILFQHLVRLYYAQLEKDRQAYLDHQLLIDASVEEFIAAAVSAVTKSIYSSSRTLEDKQKELGDTLQYMLLQRPQKTAPAGANEAAMASFVEDMVAWALNLHRTFSEREERLRQSTLSSEIIRDSVYMMIEDTIYNAIRTALEGGAELDANRMRRLEADCCLLFRQSPRLSDDSSQSYDPNVVMNQLETWAKDLYRRRIQELGSDLVTRNERYYMLEKIDENWRHHLNATDELREGIGLRGYGQKDPLLEYKREAYDLFVKMIDRIDREVVSSLFKALDVGGEIEEQQMRRLEPKDYMMTHSQVEIFKQVMGRTKTAEPVAPSAVQTHRQPQAVKKVQVGRNDPCPCGSGKKYKHCCGKNA